MSDITDDGACAHCGCKEIDAGSVQLRLDEPPEPRAKCTRCGAELI